MRFVNLGANEAPSSPYKKGIATDALERRDAMNATAPVASASPLPVNAPVNANNVPWIPLRPGLAFKPLAFTRGGEGWAILLRADPGFVVTRHRHTGEVHAYHLAGKRRLQTGEVLGPGTYLYEPPGNEDTWSSVGDEPLLVHIVATGAVEYIGEDGSITHRSDGRAMLAAYRAHA
jgi:hypothetical protein